MTLTTTPAPFTAAGWLKMSTAEQEALVQPFYADYLAALAIMKADGKYPYNDSFRGQIPGLAGASEKDEGTAIYLLQGLRSRNDMRAQVEDFEASGGVRITAADVSVQVTLRGTVAQYGWYGDDTGFRIYEDVRVLSTGGRFPRLVALPKGRRTNGYDLSGGTILFREEKKGKA